MKTEYIFYYKMKKDYAGCLTIPYKDYCVIETKLKDKRSVSIVLGRDNDFIQVGTKNLNRAYERVKKMTMTKGQLDMCVFDIMLCHNYNDSGYMLVIPERGVDW